MHASLSSRRALLRQVCGASLAAPFLRAQSRRPNVIFILADDLGWGDLGCYGNRAIRTPNLDKLASEGALFTQFYGNNPVCSPSRTAWTTGQFPGHHRVHGHFAAPQVNAARGMPNFLDPNVTTLPRLLQKAGYATAHFGKWHLGSGPGAPPPEEYGFDESRTVNSNGKNWGSQEKGDYFRANSTALLVDETLRFIEKNRTKSFYVNLWSLLPHATLNPTEEQMAMYSELSPGVGDAGPTHHRGTKVVYYSSVTELDKQIGRLLAKLDDMGLRDNTIIVFSSDNGPEDIHIQNASHSAIGSPGPFRGRKRSLYEGGVRLPLIVRWPGKTKPSAIDNASIVSAVDFLPTVCAITGVQPPPNWRLDGEDVSDIFAGHSRPRQKTIYWEWRFEIAGYTVNRSPMLAIREGQWKLLLNPDRSRVELFDIPKDPSELLNVAAQNPAVVEKLSTKVLAWQKTLPPGPYGATAGKNDWPWPGAKKTR